MKGSSVEDCGRPKKNGQPCRNVRIYGYASCHRHLTDEERARRPEIVMPESVPEPAVPACWLWPVPETPEAHGHPLLTAWQEGRCAICATAPDSGLVLDHATGFVRGYLCPSCNGQEAGHHPRHALFGLYRRHHPASILGLRLRYVDPFTGRPVDPEGPPPRRMRALDMLNVDDGSEES
ncbi:MAG: hypothetical protein HOY79_34170 [Streptomyces sp.]|nr:hypothetical protein [Streptomyces sp.]NUS11395.1 hypothetical protein [Streptomyces sp.]NUS23464.1 hypothetical protein [Streptomyces sp.]